MSDKIEQNKVNEQNEKENENIQQTDEQNTMQQIEEGSIVKKKITSFKPGEVWLDVDGVPIQAHGGGILYKDGVYYWYGENRTGGGPRAVGISCYSSTDLYNWKHEGVVLTRVLDDPNHDLAVGKVLERPKVIYNEKTGKYVMWMHIDSPDYSYARAGVAVSDKPTGPFEYIGSYCHRRCIIDPGATKRN